MAIAITGTIVPGQGSARENHRRMIPRIAARFPEVANCSRFGTINVRLDQPLDHSRADFWTPHMTWIPAQMPGAQTAHRIEAFGFTRIGFECPLGGPRYQAWIIMPEGAELTYRSDSAEVITDLFIPGVAYNARCAIHIDHTPALAAPPWFGDIYGKSLTANASEPTG